MISISLTDFMSLSGTQKLTLVKQLKKREEYRYRVDYWRELRNTITDFHADDSLDKSYFDAAIETNFLDADKKQKCRFLIDNYKKFLGRKQIISKGIIKCDWQYSKDLTIRVNPELHLVINGAEHLVKLYFKDELLEKRKVDIALLLLKIATQDAVSNVNYSLLELYRPKLWTQAEPNESLMPLLKGEAENIITIYKNLD